MNNTKDFIKFCTIDTTYDTTREKLIKFINRNKKSYFITLKRVIIYLLIIEMILCIFMAIIINQWNFIKLICNIYPFLLLGFFPLLIIVFGFIFDYLYNEFLLKNQIKKSNSITTTESAYTLIDNYSENIGDNIDSGTIHIVKFVKKGDNPYNAITVGRNHPNVYYDDLVKGHDYIFYAVNARKLFVIDTNFNLKEK